MRPIMNARRRPRLGIGCARLLSCASGGEGLTVVPPTRRERVAIRLILLIRYTISKRYI